MYTFIQNMLNLLVQIANKMGFKKNCNAIVVLASVGLITTELLPRSSCIVAYFTIVA
jgi:hypothetical protein